MGYTHYWTQTKNLSPAAMTEIGQTVRKIIAAAPDVVIRGWDGAGKPTIDLETISLNGDGVLAHETFAINAVRSLPYDGADDDRLGWSFCKTAYKPYDVVVTAILTCLADRHGFTVESDGEAHEWANGVALAGQALGYAVLNPIGREALMDYLFDYQPPPVYGTEPHKLARSDGPDTSKAAAESVNTNTREAMVHRAIHQFGEGGCIAADLFDLAARGELGKHAYSFTARLKGLQDKGFISAGPDKRLGPSGREQRVMRSIREPRPPKNAASNG